MRKKKRVINKQLIELFPFGSIRCDGVHYRFVIHTPDEKDNPSGEICPMDSDGVIMIGKNSHDLFQNLLSDPNAIEKYSELLELPELNQ